MTEYQAGDFVEAVKNRLRIGGVLSTYYAGLRIEDAGWSVEALKRDGFTVTVIEKATPPPPPLPTVPGAYAGNTGSVHVLTSSGQWLDFSLWKGTPWPKPPTGYAPFTRLEPVAETAKRIVAYAWELLSASSGHLAPDPLIGTLADEFGVTVDRTVSTTGSEQ